MTYEYRIKCRDCGLHFSVYSWSDDWGDEGCFCPECGTRGAKIIWGPVPRDEEIFSLVPGSASLSRMA